MEEQIKQTSEDSRALRELMEGERGKLRQSLEELQQLHSQVSKDGARIFLRYSFEVLPSFVHSFERESR